MNASQEAWVYRDLIVPGKIKLLYVPYGRFKDEKFLRIISGLLIDLFVVENAHCVSEWVFERFT
jgi:superfamily II DNA helicase RecQ